MSSLRADGQGERPSRRLTWAIVGLLVLSVPWYFPAGDGRPFVFGVPLWCVVSFACYSAIAAIVVIAIPRLWDDTTGRDD